jgi:hypothetical protein
MVGNIRDIHAWCSTGRRVLCSDLDGRQVQNLGLLDLLKIDKILGIRKVLCTPYFVSRYPRLHMAGFLLQFALPNQHTAASTKHLRSMELMILSAKSKDVGVCA